MKIEKVKRKEYKNPDERFKEIANQIDDFVRENSNLSLEELKSKMISHFKENPQFNINKFEAEITVTIFFQSEEKKIKIKP